MRSARQQRMGIVCDPVHIAVGSSPDRGVGVGSGGREVRLDAIESGAPLLQTSEGRKLIRDGVSRKGLVSQAVEGDEYDAICRARRKCESA